MTKGTIRDSGLARVIELLCAIDGVTCETPSGGCLVLDLRYEDAGVTIELSPDSGDYRAQKIQYEKLRETLTSLGIREGATYTPPPPPRRGMTPQIRAARDRQKQAFEAWQEVWRTVRSAEKALDVEYEIAQMKDYY
ncbi:MAG: hypothetical protein ACPGRZ_07775 [Alphaproteobacteria bacterium]